ncbi:TCP-1 chaperonin subunit alpha [Spironucleus salmonicida]|uniref:TCP-1 chaperonin subunit alpha n=1 Tax=Spironucleus salmonicida TaxID=348837 RepID=V6LAZ6_9EUKA|nr:TCP-1 chaperonin subunit alpha [Spironucleus salmonicida]|eukprot:EST41630.1 TCP-1 chaperonin subunit alpha [Spironucleus salmonicida]
MDTQTHLTQKQTDVRTSNILAARGILNLLKSSLGPRGLDKLLKTPQNTHLITNDGATIMKQLEARHPISRMLVELSQSQDSEAGDGTTSVVLICCQLLQEALKLMNLGLHPQQISNGYQKAATEALKILDNMSQIVDLSSTPLLLQIAKTTLSSKVISSYSDTLAPLIVRSIRTVFDGKNVDLRDIKIVKKLGGTVSETEVLDGMAITKKPDNNVIIQQQQVKVSLINFAISAPKSNLDSQIVVSDDNQINKLLEQERKITLKLCKQIAKSQVNVIFIQKSILSNNLSDMASYYLEKLKIQVFSNVDSEDMNFYAKALNINIATSPDEIQISTVKYNTSNNIYYLIPENNRIATIVVRGANKLIIDEAHRSIHDALCAVRCLFKCNYLVPGGGAVESEISVKLMEMSSQQEGVDQYCFRAFADAMEIILLTLSENGGFGPIQKVIEVKKQHQLGEWKMGINLNSQGKIEDMLEKQVLMPKLVSLSQIQLAVETARMILKIDDIVIGR